MSLLKIFLPTKKTYFCGSIEKSGVINSLRPLEEIGACLVPLNVNSFIIVVNIWWCYSGVCYSFLGEFGHTDLINVKNGTQVTEGYRSVTSSPITSYC